jgi:hypothetical protein
MKYCLETKKYSLSKKLPQFGVSRLNFETPFDASIASNSIYKESWIGDLMTYNSKDGCYYYEDEDVVFMDTMPPTENSDWVLWFYPKRILYEKNEHVTIYVNSPLECFLNPTEGFLGFDMVFHPERVCLSGFLVTPKCYQVLLDEYPEDPTSQGLFLPETDAYRHRNIDFIVREISPVSVNRVFNFFKTCYLTDPSWRKSVPKRFFTWTVEENYPFFEAGKGLQLERE